MKQDWRRTARDECAKTSARLSAVLTVRASGEKLPILFIVKGEPGGAAERKEVPTYPKVHVYTVQRNA